MKKTNDPRRLLARAAAVPDLNALRTELESVLASAPAVRTRQRLASDIRLNRWEGQSEDYRKHAEDIGDDAKPFEGAPDYRIPVVDTAVRERVALYVEALMSADIQAVPLGGLSQAEAATKMTRVARWLRDNKLQRELRREAELLANYVEADDPGLGIMKVYWKREASLELRELTAFEVGAEILRQRGIELGEDGEIPPGAEGAAADVEDLFFNPMREDEALETLGKVFPSVQRKRLRKAFKMMQRAGRTILPLPFVKENRPALAALRYMQEVFFAPDLDDLQRAPVIYERELLTEPELRMRVHTDGWRQRFVDEVLDKGPGGGPLDGASEPYQRMDRPGFGRGERLADTTLYEVWHAYAKAADDFGVPGVYWTVFSLRADVVGYHDLLDQPDGGYPFCDLRSEFISRGMENARGTPARVGSMQHEIKVQRDCRGAHTQLATLPPVRVAQRRGGLEAVLGPMVEVPVRDQTDVTWMNPPPFPAASIEMEKAAKSDLNDYLGRMMPGVSPELASALLQNDVNRWLSGWITIWNQIVQLQQQEGDKLEMQLVAGGPMVELSPEEIRGQFTTSLKFNVRDLNMEFIVSRNQAIGAVLQHDVTGQVDRTPIVRTGLRAVDPALADEALRDPQQVRMQEVTDEIQAVNMLANGIEAPLRKTGLNAELRLQTLMQTVTQSPVLAQRLNQPQTPADQYFAELVMNRRKNLEFLIQQYRQNPLVGRQGTAALQQTGQM